MSKHDLTESEKRDAFFNAEKLQINFISFIHHISEVK